MWGFYLVTRRPDPDKYRDFDGLNVSDYYSKGKADISRKARRKNLPL